VKHLGDEVKRELGRVTRADATGVIGELVEVWPGAVGETIARSAWPARVARDGTLHVNTADSVWAFELTSRSAEIAERLGVERIRFAPGRLPDAVESDRKRSESRPPQPSECLRQEGARLAAGIEDENLRKIVARAAAASLAKGISGRSVC
jgi:predicted nucleic acid-binding Zn ribbon protein